VLLIITVCEEAAQASHSGRRAYKGGRNLRVRSRGRVVPQEATRGLPEVGPRTATESSGGIRSLHGFGLLPHTAAESRGPWI